MERTGKSLLINRSVCAANKAANQAESHSLAVNLREFTWFSAVDFCFQPKQVGVFVDCLAAVSACNHWVSKCIFPFAGNSLSLSARSLPPLARRLSLCPPVAPLCGAPVTSTPLVSAPSIFSHTHTHKTISQVRPGQKFAPVLDLMAAAVKTCMLFVRRATASSHLDRREK